jgi:hypothetical protein
MMHWQFLVCDGGSADNVGAHSIIARYIWLIPQFLATSTKLLPVLTKWLLYDCQIECMFFHQVVLWTTSDTVLKLEVLYGFHLAVLGPALAELQDSLMSVSSSTVQIISGGTWIPILPYLEHLLRGNP